MHASQIIWLALTIGFFVLEGVTYALVSLWFGAGALVALIVAFILPNAYVAQIAAFVIISAIMLFALRPMARALVGGRRSATNADANIGKVAQVVNEVQPGRFGRVKLEGLEWTAKSDYVLPVGSWCQVLAIEGVKLVVMPVAAPPQ